MTNELGSALRTLERKAKRKNDVLKAFDRIIKRLDSYRDKLDIAGDADDDRYEIRKYIEEN